jgi:hypothetical protein
MRLMGDHLKGGNVAGEGSPGVQRCWVNSTRQTDLSESRS